MTDRRPRLDHDPVPLGRAFYARPTLDVARDLLGCRLVHEVDGKRRGGRIVETEAYVGIDDLASHASKGRTARADVMYGAPGHAYVYLIYGMHHCFNVVARDTEVAGAVLIRALEPVADADNDEHVDGARPIERTHGGGRFRRHDSPGLFGRTDGPGRLCRALGIDRRHNRLDLTTTAVGLWIASPTTPLAEPIEASPRIGVEYAGEWAARPWRFFLPANAWVSARQRRRPALAESRLPTLPPEV